MADVSKGCYSFGGQVGPYSKRPTIVASKTIIDHSATQNSSVQYSTEHWIHTGSINLHSHTFLYRPRPELMT